MEKKPTKKKKTTKPNATSRDTIDVSQIESGSAIAAGRNAKAFNFNFFGGWQISITILVLTILGISGYFVWKWAHPEKMTGGFRIAVAGFEAIGDSDSSDIGNELSQSVYNKLFSSLSDLQADYDVTVWPPAKVGKITGDTPEARTQSAQAIAERINADIVIYGVIDATNSIWQVTPEFYIGTKNAFMGEEYISQGQFGQSFSLDGQYQLGQPISLVGQGITARRLELKTKFAVRSEALSKVTIGLVYFSIREYDKALEVYKTAETIDGWEDNQGKEVLYLLMGNAAGKADNLQEAENYLNKSLAIDPEYARPYIAMAGVYYLHALEPFGNSNVRTDIDQLLLLKSIDTFNKALTAGNRPESSDVETKVHFGLGQCYFMQAYGGEDVNLKLAVDEFRQVINDYDDGKNPRVREFAAESHARLGLIYVFSGYQQEASIEYQLAADLLFDNPERQQQYQELADKYKAGVTATP